MRNATVMKVAPQAATLYIGGHDRSPHRPGPH
jgi:hypothetical protein